jgi:hypothetical protein
MDKNKGGSCVDHDRGGLTQPGLLKESERETPGF